MRKITGYDIIETIDRLPKNRVYNYVSLQTKGVIKIVEVRRPGGPMRFKRWNPDKGENESRAKIENISGEMIWRIANAVAENEPFNFDRILGGSYNTRSVLEALMAHTPEFYYCYPGRIMDINDHVTVENGHKHLMWKPEEPHAYGEMHRVETDVAISEVPSMSVRYDTLEVPNSMVEGMSIEVARRHTQIQIALYLIGLQLGFRTWIAQNDKGIKYQDVPLIEHEGIVKSLDGENMVAPYEGAANAGLLIDCIWFKNGRFMPAVMEVEHTTGVKSGLMRMLNFSRKLPRFDDTRYVIVAPDDDRDKVIRYANEDSFRELDARYFAYSAVEELYAICQRRHLHGITQEFLDCYMEKVVND